ncbi:MAG TPA: hypothetical protein VNN80_00670 [Polyangiaceae bacterium]|nr:hypothetical protein [Polyangiaceae bacterium]
MPALTRPLAPLVSRGCACLAAVASAALGSCVDQPPPLCVTSTAAFAVKLIEAGDRVESTPGACTGLGPATFNADPEVGISPYYLRAGNGQPDYKRGSIAIQTAELGALVIAAEGRGVTNTPDGQLYSRGDFASAEPDEQNFCNVPSLSPTRVLLPAIDPVADDPATADVDESLPGQAAVDATLAWSNVRVYVTADIFGTQMDGELVDTRVTPAGDSCTITYRALGLAPAIPCMALDPESGAPLTNPDGSLQLDPAACNSEADPASGRYFGSGLSPSARFECNAETGFCMIEGDSVPALR